MNKRSFFQTVARGRSRRLGLAEVLFGAMFVVSAPAVGQESDPDTELGPTFLLSLGGKLYDDLWLVLEDEPPSDRNPAVPADALVGNRASWRCATCHGWSYSGGQIGGAVFPGLRGLAGADAEMIKKRILDSSHPFPAEGLPEMALELLAYFIRDGLYDPPDFLSDDGQSIGDPELGQSIFEGACINCHQLDGRRFLRGEQGDRSSLGWVARERPEQTIHKILNGVPAAEMLSLRFMSPEQVADVFAYLQTLDASEQ